MKSAAERKAAERARRIKAGLKRYEIWLHPKDWPEVQKLLKRLKRSPTQNGST